MVKKANVAMLATTTLLAVPVAAYANQPAVLAAAPHAGEPIQHVAEAPAPASPTKADVDNARDAQRDAQAKEAAAKRAHDDAVSKLNAAKDKQAAAERELEEATAAKAKAPQVDDAAYKQAAEKFENAQKDHDEKKDKNLSLIHI